MPRCSLILSAALAIGACQGPTSGRGGDNGTDAVPGEGGPAGGTEAGGGGPADSAADGSIGGGKLGPGWNRISTGTANDLFGVDFADNKHGWAVGRAQTILHTDDGGATWASQHEGFFKSTANTAGKALHVLSPEPTYPQYHLLDVHALSPSVAWASSLGPLKRPPTGSNPDTLTAVFRTTDGGASWERIALATNFQVWAVHGLSDKSARAASIGSTSHADSDIFIIEDGVDRQMRPARFAGLRDIFFVDGKTGWVAGRESYKTSDGGMSWTRQKLPYAWYWSVQFVDASAGWMAGEMGVIALTTDGGATWTAAKSGTTSTLHGISFADRTHGWAVGQGGTILRSTDGGVSWTADPAAGIKEDLLAVKALGPSVAWIAGAKGILLVRQ